MSPSVVGLSTVLPFLCYLHSRQHPKMQRTRRSRYRHANLFGAPPPKRRAPVQGHLGAAVGTSTEAIPMPGSSPATANGSSTGHAPQHSAEPPRQPGASTDGPSLTVEAAASDATRNSNEPSNALSNGGGDILADENHSDHAPPLHGWNEGGDDSVADFLDGAQAPASGNDDNDDPDDPADIEQDAFNGSLTRWDWRVVWGIIMMTGTKKVTRTQYQSIRLLALSLTSLALKTASPDADPAVLAEMERSVGRLPHYCTIHKGYRPIIYTTLAPRFRTVRMTVDLSKRGARGSILSAGESPSIAVMIVPPSEFARADLALPAVFDVMHRNSLAGLRQSSGDPALIPPPSVLCADTSPLVKGRQWFYGTPKCISVDTTASDDPYHFAERGDCIDMRILGSAPLTPDIQSLFCVQPSDSQGLRQLQGTIVHTWTVRPPAAAPHPDVERFDASVTPRDRTIVRALSVSSYTSPADGASSVQRKAQWRQWRKPFLKPGDFVALLKPSTLSSAVSATELATCRICIVCRFWIERTERSRHVFSVSMASSTADSGLQDSNITCRSILSRTTHRGALPDTVDVVQTHLTRRQLQQPELSRTAPVSSFGTLENGEDYFVYRFLIYWDGFHFHSDKQDSGEGFYIVPLNIPPKDRASQHAVRALCVTPPGVTPEPVLDEILKDIAVGASAGFTDFDADGNRRRIFLDFVGVIGDTPAINACLDVKGHTALAACHQCNNLRVPSSRLGSRFTKITCRGSESSSRRTVTRHEALRTVAGVESCRLLGVHHGTSSMQRTLFRYSSRLSSLSTSVPRAMSGRMVVSPVFDPFRGSLIAPDHVMTGLLKCALNLTFQFLPNSSTRISVEICILAYLQECGLPRQNKLIDTDKGRLLNMSMSQLYAVGAVSPFAFSAGAAIASRQHGDICNLPPHALRAIEILKKLLGVISALSWTPVADRDLSSRFAAFDKSSGMSHILSLRQKMDSYLTTVQEFCKMPDENVLRLEQGRGTTAELRALRDEEKICKTAIQWLDRPNTHRLRELVDSTLFMVGRLDVVAELVLERRHQIMKRAIQTSNFKDRHEHALRCALLNDWQGRLRLCVRDARAGDRRARLACFRLLAGREAVASCAGNPSEEVVDSVLKSIDEAECLQSELESQNVSVLSNSRSTCGFPKLYHRRVNMARPIPFDSKPLLDAAALVLTHLDFSLASVLKELTLQMFPNSSLYRVRQNSVIRVLQLPSPDNTRVVPVPTTGEYTSDELRVASIKFWCVKRLFTVPTSSGDTQYYAEVLPVHVDDATSDGVLTTYFVPCASSTSLLHLNKSMQLTATIHKCQSYGCTTASTGATLRHSQASDRLQGNLFYILSSDTGFPPRAG